MWDKIQYKRFAVDVKDMYSKIVLANDVKILDISLSGISMKADRRLNLGCNQGNDMQLKKYDIGVEFVDLSIEDKDILDVFINSL